MFCSKVAGAARTNESNLGALLHANVAAQMIGGELLVGSVRNFVCEPVT